MKLFFRKNRGVWGIVFCVSKTRQYPKYGESGKRFALSFRKKAGGQSENFAALLHNPPSRPPFGYAVIKRGWISPCRGSGDAINPPKKGRNQPPEKNNAIIGNRVLLIHVRLPELWILIFLLFFCFKTCFIIFMV